MREVNFYTYKNGTKCELCKSCLTLHINNFEPDTFLWLLEKFDVPYLPSEWNVLRDRAYQKDPYKMNGMSVFGKYLSKMKLKQWNKYGWKDTELLQQEAELKAQLNQNENQLSEEQMKEMELAFQNGEITESQWLTYKEINEPEPTFEVVDGAVVSSRESLPSNGPYPVNDNPFEKVDLPDISSQLTEEDKIYLATKWGQLYTAADWVYLENKYNDFMNSFDIQGAARIDTLIQICKLSLKMNQALDSGDMDTYAKLVRAYDSLMKSAKFTEAQRKEEKTGDFDSVGQIVYFAEKEKGKIPRYEITTPLDVVDKAIDNLKKYTHDLIVNDPSLGQMLENMVKKRENMVSQKNDIKKAKEEGLDYVPIEDEDYTEFNELLEEKEKEKEENK
jgi:hypothetical protein